MSKSKQCVSIESKLYNINSDSNSQSNKFFRNTVNPNMSKSKYENVVSDSDKIIDKLNTPSMKYNTNNFRRKITVNKAEDVSYNCPTFYYKDTYGAWSNLDGENIDNDTNVRINNQRKFYRGKYRQPLCVRAFGGSFFGKGYHDVNGENLIVYEQNLTKSLKSQLDTSEKSYIPYSFEYLFQHSNPQRQKHIIPPKVCDGGWVRGGEDTRMELKRVCGGCFME